MDFLIKLLNYGPNPTHIAIIMDGNRRWAQEKHISKQEGHKNGALLVENLILKLYKLKVKCLTLFALSIDNLKRSKDEVEYLENLLLNFINKFESYYNKLLKSNINLKINTIGDLSLLNKNLQDSIATVSNNINNCYLKNYSKSNTQKTLNICICYNSKWEIDNIINKNNINTLTKLKENAIISKVDILIRTGGNNRLSDFLTLQSMDSCFIEIINKNWPDFTILDIFYYIIKYKIFKLFIE